MSPEPPGKATTRTSLAVAAFTLILPMLWVGASVAALPVEIDRRVEPPVAEPSDGAMQGFAPERGEAQPQVEPFVQQAPSVLPHWNRQQQVNFLLLGLDRRSPSDLPRTDVVVLASFDLSSKRATIISIPRDLVVDIPGYGQDRINSAYPVGEYYKLPGGGIKLLRATVERNFGLLVHHHALVDFDCFRGVIDAVGGVRVDVPRRIVDPLYPTPDYGYKMVVFEPGPQWLTGERALEFARTRYGDTDFGRMRRQQQVMASFREQVLKISSFANLPQAVNACGGMASDLNVIDLVALGASLRDIKSSDVAFYVIDEKLAYSTTIASGASVVMPRWEAIRAMLRSAIPGPATASVGF